MTRLRALIALALVTLAACSATPPAAASPSGPEKVTITDKTAAELLAVFNASQTAVGRKDLPGYQATIDLTRLAFRRCELEDFDTFARQGVSPPTDAKIAKLEPYLDTYVRAYLGTDADGYSRVYFRREGGKWIRTEPLDSELGGEKSKTVGGLQLTYYGIDDDVIDKYAVSANEVRPFLLKQAEGHTTGQAVGLQIFPTRGPAGATVACRVAGGYRRNVPNDPVIRLFPGALSFKPDLSGVTERTSNIIRHEGLHGLQDQFAPGVLGRMPFWLVEGWPDYIGQTRSAATKKNVVCNTPTPTYKQLEDGALDSPETPPELAGQYYSFANTMIEYLNLTYGPNAYWDLMATYKAGVDAKVNLPKVLSVTPDAFYTAWIAWTQQTYC